MRAPEQKVWPRVVSANTKALSNSEPKLAVPSAASLGLSAPLTPVTSLAMVPNFERPQLQEGDVPLPPVLPWPRRSFVAPADTQVFSSAGRADHALCPHLPDAGDRKEEGGRGEAEGPEAAATATTATTGSGHGHSPTRHVTVVRPPLSLTLPNFMR